MAVNAMAQQTVQQEHKYIFKGNSISIELAVGEVQIEPSLNKDEISVRRKVSFGLRRPWVEEQVDGDTFRVRDSNCPMPLTIGCRVRWFLQVPPDLPIDVTSQSGSIKVAALTGPVKVTSSSGAVTATALSGVTQLLSNGGPVTATGFRGSHLVATSQTGPISLTFGADPKIALAKSRTGDIEVVLPPGKGTYKISAKTDGGKSVPLSDPNGKASITVHSQSGDVFVRKSAESE